MAENLICRGNRENLKAYREGWERVFGGKGKVVRTFGESIIIKEDEWKVGDFRPDGRPSMKVDQVEYYEDGELVGEFEYLRCIV